MIYLALPSNNTTPSVNGSVLNATADKKLILGKSDRSLLTYNFNVLWCNMLNLRHTHDIRWFCMLHTDIEIKTDNWLDVLIESAVKSKADILSIVSPIKDSRGLTSTALIDTETNCVVKRLVMKEVCLLPPVFDITDIKNILGIDTANKILGVNTGVMLVKVADWCESILFSQKDYIIKTTDTTGHKTFEAQTLSEDWLFSIDAHKLGVTVKACRNVHIKHYGNTGYNNYGSWGDLDADDLQDNYIEA